MPALSITKTYQDGDILTEADLDNIRESIEGFFNTTGIDTDNIQAGGVAASDIGINDGVYLEFGTGNDGAIGVTSDDLIIKNVTTDKDIILQGSPSGVLTEILRIDSSTSSATVAATVQAVAGSVVRMATLKEFVPISTIIAYGATSAPSGWLLCDGSAVSRTTYADLFAVIAETAGQGDNVTTFNVPDLRGRFLRGRDAAAGVDPDAATRTAMATGGGTGDNLFSVQDDAFQGHFHTSATTTNSQAGNGEVPMKGDTDGGVATIDRYARAASTDSVNGSPRTAAETRPKNANVTYIIKY